MYSIAALLIFYLTITLFEYFAWLNTGVRTVIFYTYLTISSIILAKLIFLPVFKLFRIGKIISHRQAAEIIGKHFADVQDRLLNTLQLKELSEQSTENIDLIRASIDQRISKLQPVPFNRAIDLKSNRKYLKYALPPLLIFIGFLLAAPNVITEPTNRIINHGEYFEKEAPFRFVLLNNDLTAVQQDDYTIEILIEGEQVPNTVFIITENGPVRMRKKSISEFDYTYRNIQKDVKFSFEADGVKSDVFSVKVLPKPIVLNFSTELDYPGYTGRKDETLDNTGDLLIPEGTWVKWKLFTRDTDALGISFSDTMISLNPEKANLFTYRDRFLQNASYSINTKNQYLRNTDSLVFTISVIPDIYPTITVEEFVDSAFVDRIYFRGLIKDDYGFSKLSFNYEYIKNFERDIEPQLISQNLQILTNTNQQQFFHFFDLQILSLQPGDEISYFFEVWDNDGVNGSKASRTQKMIFKTPTLEEIAKNTENSNQQIKDDMESALRDLNLLQKEIDEMNRQMLEKNTLNFQDRQKLENLLNMQMSIQKRVENLQKENEEKLRNESRFKELDESLLQKHEELKKLMDELMTDEMKKMMEEIQKLLDELDKDKVSEMLEEMKMSNKDLEDELDRSLELFKQLEFEQKLQETIDKLKKLAEKQDKLAEETKDTDKDQSTDDLKEKQDELNQEFDKVRKDLDNLREKNEELENPNQMEDTLEEEKSIEESMKESSDQLQKQQNKKASEKQKDASEKMEELSDALQEMMDGMMMDQVGEDLDALRQILDNLIKLSFDQEDLTITYGGTSTNDPKYTEAIKTQFDIKDNMSMVADSLKALSKRQMAIQSIVTKELNAIDRNFELSIEAMNDRQTRKAQESQQLAMTSMNNLALLLFEAFDQMQQQMMNMQSSGKSSCPNPGKPGGSQQMKSMQQLQQQLNQQLQQMRDGQKPGKMDGRQGQQMSEQLARMAAQQSALRKKMEEFRDQLKEETGKSDGNVSKIIEDMEKTEKDIVNRQITQETIERQREILTRMLKSEKAEMQREEEERRESNEARTFNRSNPDEIFQYFKLKNREVELLKTLPPNLTPFYRNKVSEYFIRFE
ncbi:MAG: DUF4175 domain-containing protein [Bacteroidales bacterium]|nr:DUF4175 domain-containing protein [Bacteroidales bacterium]